MEYAERQPDLVKLEESEVRLEEPWHDIRQLDVYDIDGEQIGSVEDLYVDREARLPRFLSVSAGGFLGMGKRHSWCRWRRSAVTWAKKSGWW
jgi:sporulation protein YlmC with PRC-barrel domain